MSIIIVLWTSIALREFKSKVLKLLREDEGYRGCEKLGDRGICKSLMDILLIDNLIFLAENAFGILFSEGRFEING